MTEYLLSKIISIMPITFLKLLDLKYIFNLSCSCKYLKYELENIYQNMLYPNINYEIFYKDPFERSFNNDIPNLGIIGLKCLPSSNISIKKYCKFNGYKEELLSIDNHLILAIDKSGSTSTFCCNIEQGELSGSKTVLDIIKMFITTIIDIIKINPNLNIKKISIITFDSIITEYYNFESIDSILYSTLSKIISNGGTNFNDMIDYVKNNLCKCKSINHKLLVLTDCSCSVEKNKIESLLKVNCNINTCFVPPGSPNTLDIIKTYSMNSGLHQQLSIDFKNPNTIDTWCDFIGDVLSLQQVSIVEIQNKDSTKSLYSTTNSSDDYINDSIRPIYKADYLFSKSIISCNDFSGKHQHTLKNKIANKKMTHHIFGICLKKMCNSLNDTFDSLINDISEYKKIKNKINKYDNIIKQSKNEVNIIIKDINILNNKELFLESINTIIKWYKKNKFRKHLQQLITSKFIVKSIHVFKMQQIFKNNNYNYLFRTDRQSKNSNYINYLMFGMHRIIGDYENLQNRIYQIIKNTNDNYILLNELHSKIKLYDIEKIKIEINKVLLKLNTIKSIIIEGIKTDINIEELSNISISIDDVTITDTSFIFSKKKNILKIYIPIIRLPQYSNYHEVLLFIKRILEKKIYNILQNFDTYTKITKITFGNMSDDFNQASHMYLPSIQNFRDCSAPYDRTPLSRQVSESIKGTPVAYALRSVSTHR